MNPFSDVACGSCFAYSAKESGQLAEQSRRLCYALKNVREGIIEAVADRIRLLVDSDGVKGFLGESVTLVPVPGYAPWRGEKHKWVGLLLARALQERGLGRDVATLVSRTYAVRRSAGSRRSDRPTHRTHYESFTVRALTETVPSKITVVDDVLGRGATIMGAVARIRERFPDADIRGFAAIRVKSDFGDGPIVASCRHRILIGANGVRREP